MSKQLSISELVGVGLYSLSDAAQLLQTSRRKLRRWMVGHERSDAEPTPPLWVPGIPQIDGEIDLSFRDLMELRFVQAFMKQGISLQTIRLCLAYAQDCLQIDHPFSSGRFRTDGRTIFLQSLEKAEDAKLLDLKKQQFAFSKIVEQSFKDLDLEDDVVVRWRPYHGKASIIVDPARSFGQPIAAEAGIPTITLAEAVEAEGSIARVATLFEVSKAVVQDAVSFQQELKAA